MHAYDVPRRRHAYQSIRSMRAAQAPSGSSSATPIYDALYAEWVRSFRSLPGDRYGEEDLGFKAFPNIPYATGQLAAPQGTRREQQRGSAAVDTSVWQPVGRVPTGHTGAHHLPAALPPAPRRGL